MMKEGIFYQQCGKKIVKSLRLFSPINKWASKSGTLNQTPTEPTIPTMRSHKAVWLS